MKTTKSAASAAYAEKLRDPRWQKVRLRVMERDGWACLDCGDGEKNLQVHHCHYARGGPWETPEEYLRTTCKDCHDRRGRAEETIKVHILGAFTRTPIEKLEEVAAKITAGDSLMMVGAKKYDKITAAAEVLARELLKGLLP